MEKINADKGYAAKELARLEKLIASVATSLEKMDDFYYRKNILSLFDIASQVQKKSSDGAAAGKDEL